MPVLLLKSLIPLSFTHHWTALISSYKQPLQALSIATSLTLGIAASLLAIASPAKALQVLRVEPQNPKLGDTLSVVVQSDNQDNSTAPSVKMGNKTYPAFLIGTNEYRAFVPTSPLNQAGNWKMVATGDGEVKNFTVNVRSRSFPVQRINLPPGKAGVSATPLELNRVAAFKSLVTPQKFWNGAFIKPNAGRISSIYGVRRYYNGVFAKDYYHRGVDYAGGYGSPVVAPAAGRVVLVGSVAQGFRVHGNVVGIDHGQGVTGIFMHLSRTNVKEGDFVQPGQLIGAIGSTGASTGPHLHWGFYVNGVSVDPTLWRSSGLN
ncbi:Peptidase M23 [Crinalium epipsammum PCC 9333]|uniref:Peptidase M23 n=1 Tax=Crinalium epipsammum PCC 9333 TaxID=1173022 RepID=K9W2Q6_9CYAN|nr:M23 family metallopeptidase [Crinalium epipsammum]AFZ14074.1 Peptidase M23 [Crinalium epipsammum PCC 9333]